jgi:hypothetical protein
LTACAICGCKAARIRAIRSELEEVEEEEVEEVEEDEIPPVANPDWLITLGRGRCACNVVVPEKDVDPDEEEDDDDEAVSEDDDVSDKKVTALEIALCQRVSDMPNISAVISVVPLAAN